MVVGDIFSGKRFILISFLLLFLCSVFVVGESFKYNADDLVLKYEATVNYSTKNVNSSDFWDGLDTPDDFTNITVTNLNGGNATLVQVWIVWLGSVVDRVSVLFVDTVDAVNVTSENLVVTNNSELYNANVNGNFTLSNTVWDDLRFPANIIKTTGVSNLPSWDVTNFGYDFDPNTMNQAFIIAQMPHGRKADSAVRPHFHWSPSTTNVGNVTWCMEWTWASANTTFPAMNSTCLNSVANGTVNLNIHSQDIIIDGENKMDSSILKARIYRDAATAEDSFTGDALLSEFDIHYEIDSLGSDDEPGEIYET